MYKFMLRLCSFILVLALLSNMLPIQSFAEDYQVNLAEDTSITSSEKAEISAEENSETYVLGEITDKRTEYSKEFLLSNGLHMATVYPDPVHYETAGGWEEIDNTLKVTANGNYINTAGVWQVSFPQQLSSEKSVSVTKDGYTLSFALAGEIYNSGTAVKAISVAQEALSVSTIKTSAATVRTADTTAIKNSLQHAEMIPDKLYSQLAYENVYANTDIIYDLDSNRIKESVVLNRYNDALRGYRYTLDVGQLIPVLAEDGHINFFNSNRDVVVMTMPAPYLLDDNKAYSDDIQVSLTGSGSIYTLTYMLPQQWLSDADRAWPVILDPMITANVAATNILDRRISENTSWAYNHHLLEAGYDDTYGKTRSYLQFVNLPELSSADVVVGASIQLYQPTTRNNPSMQLCVNVHKVTGAWDSTSITWANQPAYDSTIEDYCMVGSTPGYYSWIITDIVRDWYADGNHGLVFKSADATENAGTDNWMQFHSVDAGTNKPILAVVFRNNSGLESYWDYTSLSAGRAGTGHINNFSGNLVWIHDTMGFGGNRMPVSITHVYNANDRNNNTFALGYGWRTNFHQRVYQWSENSNYYIWEDADGTRHYFLYDSANTYLDEDGLELKLTTNGSGTQKFCIEDKNGNKSYFDTYGRLTKQQNNQQTPSSITVTYTTSSGPLISKVTDGVGRVYEFTYSNGLLSQIGYYRTKSTEISHVKFGYSNSLLTTITDIDANACTYAYSSKLLTSVQSIDSYKLTFAYNTMTAGKPSRVSQVCEYDGSVLGGELNMEYAHNQTTFTDHNGNVEIMQFNDFGNTVSIQDDEGHAQYAQYAFNTAKDVQNNRDNTARGNQLRLSSKLQNTVGNLLPDISFESGSSSWNIIRDDNTQSVTTQTAYIGGKSLAITCSSSGTLSGVTKSIRIPGGATYTFSAYIKTGSSATAYVGLRDISTSKTVLSEALAPNSDWTRLEVSYTNTSSSSKYIQCRLLASTTGTFYADCVQLENTASASRYNLVTNGDFRDGATGWYFGNQASSDGVVTASAAAATLDSNAYRMVGYPTAAKRMSQVIKIGGNQGDTFVVAGWAKGDSAPLDERRTFGLMVRFYYTDTSVTDHYFPFNQDTDSAECWQYLCATVVAEKDYSEMYVRCAYDYNVNTVLFDGIQLYREEFGNSYTYNEEGNVISVTDLQEQETTYEYSNNNLTKEILPSGVMLTYTYDNWHNVKTATTQEGLVYNFTYDTYGNNTAVSVTGNGKTMTSTAVYSSDGNRLVSTTDALGKTTTYSYNANTNVLEWVKYPEDTNSTRTNYSYDELFRLVDVSSTLDTGNILGVSYTYNEDRLEEVWLGGDKLSLEYTNFDQISRIGTDTLSLATYTYTNDRNRYLKKLDYSNETSVEYTYDNKGRVTSKKYEDGDTVTYTYDNDGALASVYDANKGRTTKYYYDFIGRIVKQEETGTGYFHSVSYVYDDINNLTSMKETLNGVTNTTNYAYDDNNRLISVTNGAASKEYTYDQFGRLTGEVSKLNGETVVTHTPAYYAPSANSTSGQVASYQVSSNGYNKTFSYTYDDNGNIASVSDGTNTTTYAYDSANQLIRENNQAANKTWTWEYDNLGNILCKKEYTYTTGTLGTPRDTIQYGYDSDAWGQLLTSYDDSSIVYSLDDGNYTVTPFIYDGREMYWEHGRELGSIFEPITQYYFNEYTFTYDANGMRTSKEVYHCDDESEQYWTDTYEYTYNGSLLTRMYYHGAAGWWTMDFRYDADGTPISVTFEHVAYEEDWEWGGYLGEETAYDCCAGTYYYMTNLQGDVIALVNESGDLVGTYTYDAWGKPLSTTGSACIMRYNPLRYRGYVYDTETGFYYLQSRYYDPARGRFISPDSIEYLGADGSLLSYNLFAYCKNNPIMGYDPTGHFGFLGAIIATGAIVGGLLGAFSAATTGGNVLESAIEGCLTGALGATCGILISNPIVAVGAATFGGSAIDFTTQVTSQYIEKKSVDLSSIDYGRVAKTGLQTGIGTAIPVYGKGAGNAVDAFGTALIWAEGSALITTTDVVITNLTNTTSKGEKTRPGRRLGVSILDRELLLT